MTCQSNFSHTTDHLIEKCRLQHSPGSEPKSRGQQSVFFFLHHRRSVEGYPIRPIQAVFKVTNLFQMKGVSDGRMQM